MEADVAGLWSLELPIHTALLSPPLTAVYSDTRERKYKILFLNPEKLEMDIKKGVLSTGSVPRHRRVLRSG